MISYTGLFLSGSRRFQAHLSKTEREGNGEPHCFYHKLVDVQGKARVSLMPPSAHPSQAFLGNSPVIVASVLLPFLTVVPEQSPTNLISDHFTAH